MKQPARRWPWLIPVMLGILFGCCTYAFNYDSVFVFLDAKLFFLVGAFVVLFVVLFFVLDQTFSWIGAVARKGRVRSAGHTSQRQASMPSYMRHRSIKNTVTHLLPCTWNTSGILRSVLLLIMCWMPYFIAMFPGFYWVDTTNQIVEFTESGNALNAGNPLSTTILFGLFARLGFYLSGSYLVGLYAIIILQGILACAVIAASICYLENWNTSWGVRLILLLLVALFPVFPCTFATLAKDTIHAPFFVLFCMCICESARTKGGALSSPRWAVLFAVSIACTILTKKTALYIDCLSLALLIVYLRDKRAWFIASVFAITVLLSNVAIPIVAGSVRPVIPDGKQEVLAVPLQQVANVVRLEPTSFSEDEVDLIDRIYLMGFDGIPEAYLTEAADGVKRYEPSQEASYSDFIGLWGRHIPRNFSSYLGAWGGLAFGWFGFSTDQTMLYRYDLEHVNPTFKQLPGYTDTLVGGKQLAVFSKTLRSTKILLPLLQRSFWASILLAALIFIVVRYATRSQCALFLVIGMPIILTFLTLIVGPTSYWAESIRYVLPMVCTYCLVGGIVGTVLCNQRGCS